MSSKYVRVGVPEGAEIEDFAKSMRQKFAAADKKGKGGVLSSITPDESHEGVLCAKVSGNPTQPQMQLLKQYPA